MTAKTLIVLIGPTGVGKTELSLRIAEYFKTSIISSDSRQLYAELKIGTAAPTPEQLKRVPHYFVGTLQLTDYYSAAQYETEVMSVLEQLFQQHHVVLLTGGSMMYVDAICKGIDDIPTVDAETRELLLHKYDRPSPAGPPAHRATPKTAGSPAPPAGPSCPFLRPFWAFSRTTMACACGPAYRKAGRNTRFSGNSGAAGTPFMCAARACAPWPWTERL